MQAAEVVRKHGFAAAAEVNSLDPPQCKLTVVIPDAAKDADTFREAVQTRRQGAEVEVREETRNGRAITFIEAGPTTVAMFTEGKHAVYVVSTDKLAKILTKLDAKGDKLTSSPDYKKLAAFKDSRPSRAGS